MLAFFVALLNLSRDKCTVVPFFATANSAIQQTMVCFRISRAYISSYCNDGGRITTILSSLLTEGSSAGCVATLGMVASISPRSSRSCGAGLVSGEGRSIDRFLRQCRSGVSIGGVRCFSTNRG